MLPAKSILKNIGYVPPQVFQCSEDQIAEFYAYALEKSMENVDTRSNKYFWLSFLFSQQDDRFLKNTPVISWVNMFRNINLPEDKKQRTAAATDSRVLFSGRATSRVFDVNDCATSLGKEEEFTDMATIVHTLTASASLVGCEDEVVVTVFSCVRCVFLWKLRTPSSGTIDEELGKHIIPSLSSSSLTTAADKLHAISKLLRVCPRAGVEVRGAAESTTVQVEHADLCRAAAEFVRALSAEAFAMGCFV